MNLTPAQLLALMASIIWAGHYAKKADPALGVGLETCIEDAKELIRLAHQ